MNYIIGGGITGLVTGLYFRTFVILTKGKGQEFSYMGPKILKKTKEVDSFIERFVNRRRREESKDELKSCSYTCGCSVNRKFLELNDELREKYLKKTRGDNWEKFKESGMNDGELKIEGYDMVEIYHDLLEIFDLRTRRIFLNVKKINFKTNIISGINPVHKGVRLAFVFNKIINTLPALLFNSLVEGEFNYKLNSQIFVCIVESKEMYEKLKDYSFVYYPGNDVSYYRTTIIGKNRIAIESCSMFIPKKDLEFECKVLKGFRLPFGKVVEDIDSISNEGLAHVGRYALNNNDIRLHDLIKELENKEIRV